MSSQSSPSHQSSGGGHRRTDHPPESSSQQPALFRANPFIDDEEQARPLGLGTLHADGATNRPPKRLILPNPDESATPGASTGLSPGIGKTAKVANVLKLAERLPNFDISPATENKKIG